MSGLFNRLPGHVRSPAGLEREVLRALPRVLVVGSLLLMLPPAVARVFWLALADVSAGAGVSMVDIYSVSLLVLHWTVVFTVAIAAFIVMVMKGPAYVADAYPVADADAPAGPLPRSRR